MLVLHGSSFDLDVGCDRKALLEGIPDQENQVAPAKLVMSLDDCPRVVNSAVRRQPGESVCWRCSSLPFSFNICDSNRYQERLAMPRLITEPSTMTETAAADMVLG